ncbi:MAG: GNAT family N-acetyltransferase [Ruminococcaceae bacterium]|nr:GNAT family N-acetyltransferase [Oscillospiraceae bacterium]
MNIKTKRLLIRDFRMDDAEDLQEILGDGETMKYSEEAYTLEKTKNFLQEFCIASHGALAAVHAESGRVIGYILFKETEERVYELGWFFNRTYWRQGYAYEACSAVIAHAFGSLKARKIFAETIDAAKSVPLMKKLGMKQEELQAESAEDIFGNPADMWIFAISAEAYIEQDKDRL